MEQWILDGRDTIRKRGGRTLLPAAAVTEEEGFTADLTHGLRGILKRTLRKGSVAEDFSYTPGGTPQQQTECLIKVAYFYAPIPTAAPSSWALADCVGFNRAELSSLGEGAFASRIVNIDPAWEGDATDLLPMTVGAGQIPQGVEECILTMEGGEVAELFLDPAFAFRGDGFTRPTIPGAVGIPPDAVVRALVELCAFEHAPTPEERVDRADRCKTQGNKFFQAGDWNGALRKYHEAFEKLGSKRWKYDGTDPTYREKDIHVRSTLYSNMAACWAKKGNNEKIIEFCDKALQVNPQHVKARFRRAQVRETRVEFELARADLHYLLDSKLITLTADERKDVETALARINKNDHDQTHGQNEAYRKMFWGTASTGSGQPTTTTQQTTHSHPPPPEKAHHRSGESDSSVEPPSHVGTDLVAREAELAQREQRHLPEQPVAHDYQQAAHLQKEAVHGVSYHSRHPREFPKV